MLLLFVRLITVDATIQEVKIVIVDQYYQYKHTASSLAVKTFTYCSIVKRDTTGIVLDDISSEENNFKINIVFGGAYHINFRFLWTKSATTLTLKLKKSELWSRVERKIAVLHAPLQAIFGNLTAGDMETMYDWPEIVFKNTESNSHHFQTLSKNVAESSLTFSASLEELGIGVSTIVSRDILQVFVVIDRKNKYLELEKFNNIGFQTYPRFEDLRLTDE